MRLQNKKILMFEDNIENIIVQKTYLEKDGAEVIMFLGGQIDNLVNQMPIDLIIMDLMIPNMNGFEYAEIIQQHSQLSAIPLIAVSAMDASIAIPKVKASGFAGFIAKPVNVDEFASQVEDVLNGKAVWSINRH